MADDAGPPWEPPSEPPAMPPSMPPPLPPPAPEEDSSGDRARRRNAWILGGVAEVVLLWWLAQMAWSGSVDEPALSTGDGLVAIAVVGAAATAFIVAGAVAYATGKRGSGTVAGVVLGVVGGVVGFVGGLLVALTRVDSGEH